MRIQGNWQSRRVWVDGKELSPGPSLKVWNHSPDGFAWGYGGSGPAQLALALALLKLERDKAVQVHQSLKWELVAKLPQADFSIDFDFDTFLTGVIGQAAQSE